MRETIDNSLRYLSDDDLGRYRVVYQNSDV